MEKQVSFDVEHIARVRGLSHSKSSLKRPTRSPIPKTNSISRVSPGPSDAIRRKRVKFSGSTSMCKPEVMRDGPSPQNEGAHLSCSDGAKTSEFKSFKRLIEKTAHKHYFDKAAKSDIKLKKGKAMGCMEASSNAIPSKSDVRMSSLPVQNVSSIVQGFLSSPSQSSLKQEFKNKAEGINGAARSVALSRITPVDLLFHPSAQIVGKICGGGHSGPRQELQGTFSGKRAYLLQLTAGTCLQNIDDFLSNRSDFIFEILQRLGIRRYANTHDKLQKPEQKMSAYQFPASSKRSNHMVEFCDDSQENLCTYKTGQYDNLLVPKWDNTNIQAFPYKHSPKTSFKCKQKPDLFNEKCATVSPFFNNPASAIELIKEFDCNKYSYRDEAHTLLNSPCGISEVNIFPTDCAAYMGQLFKNLHFNSALDQKGLFELFVTKDEATSWNSKVELDHSSHGHHRRNHDSFQANWHYILPSSYNSERCFQEQALVPYINDFSTGLCIQSPGLHLELTKEQFTLPLLEWDATTEQELSAPKCHVPKEVDHFTTCLYDTSDFNNEIGTSSFFNGYGRRSFNFLQSYSFDFMLQDPTHHSKRCGSIHPTSATPIPPGSLFSIQNYSDGSDHSSAYSDCHFSMVRQGGGVGWFLDRNRENDYEDDINFMGAPNDFPFNIFSLTELQSLIGR